MEKFSLCGLQGNEDEGATQMLGLAFQFCSPLTILAIFVFFNHVVEVREHSWISYILKILESYQIYLTLSLNGGKHPAMRIVFGSVPVSVHVNQCD